MKGKSRKEKEKIPSNETKKKQVNVEKNKKKTIHY